MFIYKSFLQKNPTKQKIKINLKKQQQQPKSNRSRDGVEA